MLLEGYIFLVGKWKNLTKKERNKMKKKYSKLKAVGESIKHYHERKVDKTITLVFSSNKFLQLCDGVEWAVQYSPGFLARAESDDKAVPEGFVLIPDLDVMDLAYLKTLIIIEQIEVRAFYQQEIMYQAHVMGNGQLFMRKIW